MNIYVDSSALLKRAVQEPESLHLIETLEAFVADGHKLCSSTLAWIESTRALRSQQDRVAPVDIVEGIETAVSGVIEYPVTEQVAEVARRIGPSSLRTLDAIHLATATLIAADLVVAYDQRLLVAAEELGFRTSSPGWKDSN